MKSGKISVDNIIFDLQVGALKQAGDSLTTTKKDFSGYESKINSIEKFVELYGELASLISDYKQLLLRDAATVQEVGHKFNNMDQQLTSLWK